MVTKTKKKPAAKKTGLRMPQLRVLVALAKKEIKGRKLKGTGVDSRWNDSRPLYFSPDVYKPFFGHFSQSLEVIKCKFDNCRFVIFVPFVISSSIRCAWLRQTGTFYVS